MLRTMDGRMEWVDGRERRVPHVSVPPELVTLLVAAVVLLALVL